MLRGYSELRKRDKLAGDHSYKSPDGDTDKNHQLAMIEGRAKLKEASAKYRVNQFVKTSVGNGRIIEISANGSIAIRTTRGLRKVISPDVIIE